MTGMCILYVSVRTNHGRSWCAKDDGITNPFLVCFQHTDV